MSRFNYCYYADGLIWCQHKKGTWAPPFPVSERIARGKKEKTDLVKESVFDQK